MNRPTTANTARVRSGRPPAAQSRDAACGRRVTMRTMLQLDQVTLRRGANLLFAQARAQMHAGWKVGVTGANGCGKSSLFALIRGELHADAGDCRLPADWVIAHIGQELPADDRPAIEHVLDGDQALRDLERELGEAESAGDGARLAELHGRYESIGGYTARSRAARLLHGLGFRAGEEQNSVASLSGGWRMRVNLARALMCRSDLLLLDEPTNHLDLDAVLWLEDWLRAYGGTLLVISHDRDFLDNIATHVLHIERQGVTLYAGNYSAFERVRAERLANQQSEHEKQQRAIVHMRRFVERFRAKATKARQAQSRLKALQRMEPIAAAHVDSPFHFALPACDRLPDPLLRLDRVSARYAERSVLQGVNLELSPGDRVGLLGPNGAGKSTLVKLLAGVLAPAEGRCHPAQDLRIGYFAQHQVEQLDPAASPLLHLQRLDRRAREQDLRDYLGGFGFVGDQTLAAVAPFSGGEKSRLALALLTFQRPNLLLLDEPTNHLDLDMRQALAEALQDFAGAVVLVTHDRHLLRVTCDRLLLVNDGRVEDYPEELDAYPNWLAGWRRSQFPANGCEPRPRAVSRKDQRRSGAEQRQALQPLVRRLADVENSLARLTADRTRIGEQLADPALYGDAGKDRLRALLREKGDVDKRIERDEGEWLETSEELETLRGQRPAP